MKAVILAGGFGTRISEESHLRPKPMIEIGGRPILWHIMKTYAHFGIKEFIVCLGYRGYAIKEYFANYFLHMSDVSFDMAHNRMDVLQNSVEPWRVTLIETGANTMTGGRLKRVRDHIGDETFCLTYGDGLADIDMSAQLAFHRAHKRLATVTAIQPPGRFGALVIDAGRVVSFQEKPAGDGAWISGGFFVLEPKAIDLVDGDETSWEGSTLVQLAEQGDLMSYQHRGFWQPMDTMRDKNLLEDLWASGKAPWKVWD